MEQAISHLADALENALIDIEEEFGDQKTDLVAKLVKAHTLLDGIRAMLAPNSKEMP